ncbi:MAG: single-stranded-DNA-specific exonuclease RecJ [Chloroflexia bacterium]|nr:single-stranded-DNA-specific exonuclease RecJ [Chloroflexia bacterium]
MSLEWIEPASTPPAFLAAHPDPLLAALLARRLSDPAQIADFLNTNARPSPDPWLLPNMDRAIARISRAVQQGERIGLFGDYDTDGVTSSAILTLALRAASGGAQPYTVRLPYRAEGYGLSVQGVTDLADAGTQLLIAVDCGSKDHAAVEAARQRGLDVIIVDHHRIIEAPPDDAIIVSAQLDPASPYQGMSASGLAYLVAVAMAQAGLDAGDGPGNEPRSLLDLAMIGLVGDVSPLVGVNRSLVRDGLRVLRNGHVRPGLRALADSAGMDLRRVSSSEIAFQLSPRLNAPGRLADARPAYELLVADDLVEARTIAAHVSQANQRRKTVQQRIHAEVEALLSQDRTRLDRRFLLVSGQGWEKGIVGLVASKLSEQLDRPVGVLSIANGEAHGSARSIPGFDLAAALAEHDHLLLRHGGHERAAGLAVAAERLADLEEALHLAVIAAATPPPGPGRLAIDADLPVERMTLETLAEVQKLGPFGEANPQPVLRVRGAPLREYLVMGSERQHLKLQIGHSFPGVSVILWGGAHRSRELVGQRTVDLAGVLECNEWQGARRIQMRLMDFKVT